MSEVTAAAAGSDRRKHERRPLRATALVTLPDGQKFEVRTTDITVEGMGIVAAANPRAGTAFHVQVTLPVKPSGTLRLDVRVKVVHSILAGDAGGFKIGLKFVSPDAAAEAAVLQYLK